MNISSDPCARLARAALSLEGLSVGDAFGNRYFTSGADELIAARTLAYAPWGYTDDTQMALSVFSILRQHDRIEQDALATNFSVHYEEDRSYGDANEPSGPHDLPAGNVADDGAAFVQW